LVLAELYQLPHAVVARDEEVVLFVTRERLFGLGIGYVDAHLLASAKLSADTAIWTRDRRMAAAAARLGVAHSLPR
jgi:predicted nucleic acid-binding protein